MSLHSGLLPPGAAEQLSKTLESYRNAKMVSGVEILPGPDCDIAEAQAGTIYPLDSVPALPFPGCQRSPCCGCCYIPVLSERVGIKSNGMSSMTKKILTGFGLVWVLVVIASLLLGGCSTYKPTSPAWTSCDGARCDELWSRVQVWVAKNSAYRIQITNDNILQTYGPTNNIDSPAYTITKEKQGSGAKIIIHAICFDPGFGCMYDPSPYANALLADLKRP